MKVLGRCRWVSFLGLLSACSFHPAPVLLQPVGPVPPESSAGPPARNEGYLVVYSAWSSFVDLGSVGHHSRYTIRANDQAQPREIINHADRFDEGPIRLSLAPGSYHVTARATHAGRVVVPVVIKPQETTFVYLDGSNPQQAGDNRLNAVQLPDGEIVGWAATGKGN